MVYAQHMFFLEFHMPGIRQVYVGRVEESWYVPGIYHTCLISE